MQLEKGKVAVVTGAASGIGLALAERWARAGLDVVLADVDEAGLAKAAEMVEGHGVRSAAVPTDVSDERSVAALASTAFDRFGAVHLLCNNAGVSSKTDPWLGPTSSWKWVIGVNLWGVIHGVRAFLPAMLAQGEGHIVNTASIAGLWPGFVADYDATKHAVVALTEHLYRTVKSLEVPIGVSVLCPGWVRTAIVDAERNWPARLGEKPDPSPDAALRRPHLNRVIDGGMPPADVAELVAGAVEAERFWIFTAPEFMDLAVRRWQAIAEGQNPDPRVELPGFPPAG
jgi:NAD(P)-dependent dehydrogenase (short-subunit alcohol dehydrogenase family)